MTDHQPRPRRRATTRQIFDVRIYPSDDGGFDIMVRVRGFGLEKLSNWPTLQAAINEATKVEGQKLNAPVYVFSRSFPEIVAEAITAIVLSPESSGARE